MFKVESTSASTGASALSLNSHNNFDFGLSFCDDGTTEDLFDSFASPSGMDSGNSIDTVRIKTEPEDPEEMSIGGTEVESESNSPAVTSGSTSL